MGSWVEESLEWVIELVATIAKTVGGGGLALGEGAAGFMLILGKSGAWNIGCCVGGEASRLI